MDSDRVQELTANRYALVTIQGPDCEGIDCARVGQAEKEKKLSLKYKKGTKY